MTTRCPQTVFKPEVMNGSHPGPGPGPGPGLEASRQPSGALAQPLRGQPAVEQLTSAKVQASLSRFTACTVPASCRARSRFLNLRDSVKKSPTKSTAKVVGSCPPARQQQIPWVPSACHKVAVTGPGAWKDVSVFSCRQPSTESGGAARILLEELRTEREGEHTLTEQPVLGAPWQQPC